MSEQIKECLLKRLTDPFPEEFVEWQIYEMTANKRKVFVIPTVDLRHYEARLNEVAPGWERHYELLLPICNLIRCRLVIMGESRDGIAEDFLNDSTFVVDKINRAFLRACQTFGLGKYLLFLSGYWVAYDPETNTTSVKFILPAWALPGGDAFQPDTPGRPREQTTLNLKASGTTRLLATKAQGSTDTQNTPSQPSRLPDNAYADASALKAWVDLISKARQVGLTNIDTVVPPIKVGELRMRYATLRNLITRAQVRQQA
jgi:hypothetical protein